ncbi:SpoIIE family protein phosphatase [Magnetospira sp. QH-2]|uniref:SpoIIE family protein phosphatase n=1 Tax=Magnetospira sp. (strain QH-2) TaxID=1288970 RepID=UPI0003E81559|nr:SpoIIE family protein phosphatase [Magnetospira sp. QH-2]CCQ73617.1 Protein of unknown function [Magnetospira sp. QH-2]
MNDSLTALEKENRILRKQLARSESNRAIGEGMKDQMDVLYQSVIEDLQATKNSLTDAFDTISESIHYASRIQRSVLPTTEVMARAFADHFVLWEPRDVVGGDIYWCGRWGDGVLILLGDCTGHGVPGAFMTLIAIGAIERAKPDLAAGDVSTLIQRVNQYVQTTLGQDSHRGESDDGLELGACFVNTAARTLTYSGARFDLFVVDRDEVLEIKGTKKGIGYRGIDYAQRYDLHNLQIRDDCRYYLTSDGLIDQIGGERRRSFGKKRFRALLRSVAQSPMSEQSHRILQALADFQGAEKRRDDVSVIGFKVF